ncbi:hypothetical protein HAX54_044611 [Datura stramonium]|uniref:Uncharacterized protein n=1 Tax=Datura stramonium TaxID=4076 RepID=A0ABS8SPY3_DATST|nr:hypothetical protein [Datura stramonium]
MWKSLSYQLKASRTPPPGRGGSVLSPPSPRSLPLPPSPRKFTQLGRSELGWCEFRRPTFRQAASGGICPADSGYRLRNKDGSRGHGVVNVAVKLEASFVLGMHPQRSPLMTLLAGGGKYSPVLGIR